MKTAIYLRKSRHDNDNDDTLQQHRNILLEYAKKHTLNVVEIYEEIVSGDSILNRPKMLQLLSDIENNMYDAVLCIDMQRLGRGDMEEQGLILKKFKNSSTKIITPYKTYNLDNDFDEEYTEFEAFMSRKEYKMITRRMQRGVIESVKQGNYLSALPPFGYTILSTKEYRTLKINYEQSEIVKMIFDNYINSSGAELIAQKLNSMNIKTIRGNKWTHNAVRDIITNKIYIGMITWQKIDKTRNKRNEIDWIIVKGRHDAIIPDEVYNQAQIMRKNNYIPPTKKKSGLSNPLAGLVICKTCGSKMTYRMYNKSGVDPHLICNKKCGNKSSKFKYIEEKIIQTLYEKLNVQLELNADTKTDNTVYFQQVKVLNTELEQIISQKNKLHDLLEKGIYEIDTFLERSKILEEKKSSTLLAIEETKSILESVTENKITVDEIKTVLDVYNTCSLQEKNMLLKSILDKIEYYKSKTWYDNKFEVEIYLKI